MVKVFKQLYEDVYDPYIYFDGDNDEEDVMFDRKAIEQNPQVDQYVSVEKAECHRERLWFVRKVYFVVLVSVVMTVATALIALVSMTNLIETHYADLLGWVVYLTFGLTTFFVVTISYISYSGFFDFTPYKCIIWLCQLAWLLSFIILWHRGAGHHMLLLWATFDLVLTIIEMIIDSQMIYGGRKYAYSTSHWLLAPMNLFCDIVLLFVLTLPIMCIVLSSMIESYID